MKSGELLSFVSKHGINVPRLGRLYLWTEEVVREIVKCHTHIKDGLCVHCGNKWDNPSTRTDSTLLSTDEDGGGE